MAFGRIDNSSRITAVTDTLGNTWTRVAGPFVGSGSYVEQWATFNIASGGANTVSITGTSGQIGIWEFGLGPNAKFVASGTGHEGSGTSHAITAAASTGNAGTFVASAQFSLSNYSSSTDPNILHVMNSVAQFCSFAGNVTAFGDSPTSYSSAGTTAVGTLCCMYTDIESTSIGDSSGTGIVTATGLALFEGGNILLETGDRLLLEDGDGGLLESSAEGGNSAPAGLATVLGVGVAQWNTIGSSAGAATVTGVGDVPFDPGVGSSSGSATVTGIGIPTVSTVGSSSGTGIATGVGDTTGTANAGSGSVTFSKPSLSGSGQFGVSGTGSVTFGAPLLASGLLKITQQGRQVVEDESQPTARLTQFGRQVVEAESHPGVRLTQMARQVLYTFTCDTETPPVPIDVGVIHILRSAITPRWKLERFDQKIRQEDGVNVMPLPGVTPSWHEDGSRWRLERLDIELSPHETGETGDSQGTRNSPSELLLETGDNLLLETGDKVLLDPDPSSWRLYRFDIFCEKEEIS